ncbi:hypothetical protein [Acinetobacter baumannii]|uniref:hypothetical protein n=1 Tax=Acinetobacter baumannii TaxID=470 RepID=UPI003D2FE32E
MNFSAQCENQAGKVLGLLTPDFPLHSAVDGKISELLLPWRYCNTATSKESISATALLRRSVCERVNAGFTFLKNPFNAFEPVAEHAHHDGNSAIYL